MRSTSGEHKKKSFSVFFLNNNFCELFHIKVKKEIHLINWIIIKIADKKM